MLSHYFWSWIQSVKWEACCFLFCPIMVTGADLLWACYGWWKNNALDICSFVHMCEVAYICGAVVVAVVEFLGILCSWYWQLFSLLTWPRIVSGCHWMSINGYLQDVATVFACRHIKLWSFDQRKNKLMINWMRFITGKCLQVPKCINTYQANESN